MTEKPKLVNVEPLRPYGDIVTMLRDMAERIENGDLADVIEVALVTRAEAGHTEVYGWGHGTWRAGTHYLLHNGMHKLMYCQP